MTAISTNAFAGNGGAYLRVSDDEQEIGTQRTTIAEFETRNNVKIAARHRYEDVDWSRDEIDRRPEWLRMLADVDGGKLQWLVVAAKDRFGTASGRRKVLFYTRLWDAKCKLILASTGEVLNAPNLVSDLNALVDGDQEERELREKSNRALEKMRQHAAVGRWMGGSIPYGLDVVCTDITGREFWRVQIDGPDVRCKIKPDGTRQVYDGRNNFPGRDKGQWLTLRPTTDAARLAVLGDVFQWFDKQALSVYQIATRLNDAGERHHKGEWAAHHVETMLTNMAYIGIPTWNRTSRGKWSEHVGGRTVPHAERNTKIKEHGRADWIIPDQQFEPIIPIEVFAQVQDKVAQRSTDPRAPKSPDLWLSGLLFCAKCGSKFHGTCKAGVPKYVCGSYLRKMEGKAQQCEYLTVTHAEAEEWLRDYFGEVGQLLPRTPKGPPAKIAAQMQSAWTDAMHRMGEAAKDMHTRVAEWARTADDAAVAKISHRRKMIALDGGRPVIGADGQFVEVEGEPRVAVKDVFRAVFTTSRDQDQARLDQLDTEHTNVVLAWQALPTQRAKDKAATRLRELEEEIADLERRVTDAAATHDQATGELSTLLTEWDAAREAVAKDTNSRTRATDVRKVIDRVNISFALTGRKKPKYYVDAIEIIPAGGAAGEVSNAGSAGRRRTAKRAATRGSACGTCRSPSARPPATGGSRSCRPPWSSARCPPTPGRPCGRTSSARRGR